MESRSAEEKSEQGFDKGDAVYERYGQVFKIYETK